MQTYAIAKMHNSENVEPDDVQTGRDAGDVLRQKVKLKMEAPTDTSVFSQIL